MRLLWMTLQQPRAAAPAVPRRWRPLWHGDGQGRGHAVHFVLWALVTTLWQSLPRMPGGGRWSAGARRARLQQRRRLRFVFISKNSTASGGGPRLCG